MRAQGLGASSVCRVKTVRVFAFQVQGLNGISMSDAGL